MAEVYHRPLLEHRMHGPEYIQTSTVRRQGCPSPPCLTRTDGLVSRGQAAWLSRSLSGVVGRPCSPHPRARKPVHRGQGSSEAGLLVERQGRCFPRTHPGIKASSCRSTRVPERSPTWRVTLSLWMPATNGVYSAENTPPPPVNSTEAVTTRPPSPAAPDTPPKPRRPSPQAVSLSSYSIASSVTEKWSNAATSGSSSSKRTFPNPSLFQERPRVFRARTRARAGEGDGCVPEAGERAPGPR